jgi:hypothetical protein
MIVCDFNVPGAIVRPRETDPPLTINADAMLARAVAFKFFEAISRRYPQVVNSFRGFDQKQLPQDKCFNGLKPPRANATEYCFSVLALEAAYHADARSYDTGRR